MIETPEAAAPSTRRSLPDWWGWVVVALISLVVLATWLPHMGVAFGDSAEGRVLARLGLHVRNFWELGAAESGFGASMRPYVFSTNYAHHPPLVNFFEVGTSALLGQGEWQTRVYGYLAGIGTIWCVAALLRLLGLRWAPVLLSVGMMAATNMFWVYGRVGGGFALVTALAAMVVYLRTTEAPPTAMVVLGGVVGFATAMTSWPAMATAALLGIWLWRGRGADRVTVSVGAGMVLAVAVTAAWILNATDLADLRSQTELRTGGTFTWLEFVERQWFRATELTPSWYRALLFPALAAGLADRRSRWPTALLFVAPFAWTFGGREGAFNHEFWNLPWMAAIAVGMAALFDAVLNASPKRLRAPLVGLAGLGLVLAFSGIVTGRAYDKYFGVASEAGVLVQRVESPAGQPVVWVLHNVPGARWVAYYWDRPLRVVTEDTLAELPADEIIIVRTWPVPSWIPETLPDLAIESEGRYAIVNVGELQELVAGG